MLSRRGFVGCWICAAVSGGFAATEVAAQGTPASRGLTRKILLQADAPRQGYVTIVAEVEVAAGAVVGRHTHPGVETEYVIEGEIELPIGNKTLHLKPGDSFEVSAGVVHGGGKASDTGVKIISTFVVKKNKPLATPA